MASRPGLIPNSLTNFVDIGYADAHFHETLDENEEWIGPFADYEVAKRE